MPRSVREWIGRTGNSQPTDECKMRILERQGRRCALTGHEFRPGDVIEFDHKVPLWLGGENRENNLQAVLGEAHKRKTKAEATVRGKVKASAKKHLLGKKKSRGWSSPFKQKMDGTIIDTRTGEIVKEGRRA